MSKTTMSLKDFMVQFGDADGVRKFFESSRWPYGAAWMINHLLDTYEIPTYIDEVSISSE